MSTTLPNLEFNITITHHVFYMLIPFSFFYVSHNNHNFGGIFYKNQKIINQFVRTQITIW